MSKIIEDLYRAILDYGGLEADEQGFISVSTGGKPEPAFIDGLRMVLPTYGQLRSFNPKEKVVFHPLTENVLRGESEVIQKLKYVINVKMNVTIGHIVNQLLSLIASPQLHGKLTPEQSELLYSVKDGDEKTSTEFTKQMISGIKATPDRCFVNVYLKRGGTFKGERYARVGIVTFPFYEGLKSGKIEKLRAKDKETLIQVFQFVFPDIDKTDEYNFGSHSHVAPFLEALMMSSANVASRLNDLLTIFSNHITESKDLVFNSEWVETVQNLPALIPEIRKIPPQAGNEGSIPINKEEPPQAPVPQAPVYQTQVQPIQPPIGGYPVPLPTQSAPSAPPKVGKKGMDFRDFKASTPGMAYVPNPMAMPQSAPMGYIPQGMMPQPGYGMQMQPAPMGYMPQPQNPVMMQPAMMQPGMAPQMQQMQQQMVQTPFGALNINQPVRTVGGMMPLYAALQQGLAYQPAN